MVLYAVLIFAPLLPVAPYRWCLPWLDEGRLRLMVTSAPGLLLRHGAFAYAAGSRTHASQHVRVLFPRGFLLLLLSSNAS